MKKYIRFVVTAYISLVLVACANSGGVIKTYSGQPDPALVTRVSVPESIEIKTINDESFDRLIKVGETTYAFMPGEYKVTLQYLTLWDISSDEHEVVKSKLVEQTWHLQAGAVYQLKSEKAKDLGSAREIAQSFQPWLVMEKTGMETEEIPPQVADTLPDSQVVEELKSWWQKANKLDKERFRSFIEQEK